MPTRSIQFRPDNAIFGNPERGVSENHLFYSVKLKPLAGFLDSTQFTGGPKAAKPEDRDTTRLVNYITTLDRFRDTDVISQDYLNHLRADFATARERGVKLITSFTYWSNGPECRDAGEYKSILNCAVRNRYTDVPADRMLKHIKQLEKEVIKPNADVVAYSKAGFIGAWGEWNKSSHGLGNDIGDPRSGALTSNDGDQKQSKQIFEAIQDMVGPNRSVALRYSSNRQDFYGDDPLSTSSCYATTRKARVGGHDDYLGESGNSPYLTKANSCVPYGGEGMPNSLKNFSSSAGLERQLRAENWTNMQPISLGFSDWPATYQRIKRDLGYRYELTKATVPVHVKSGKPLTVTLSMKNNGYGNLYNARPAELVLVEKGTGKVTRERAVSDVRRLLPQAGKNGKSLDGKKSFSLTVTPKGLRAGATYTMYVAFPDASPRLKDWRYSIRLASRSGESSIFDQKLGANRIGEIQAR
ncbi:MAG: DUF4874 domain-containing protein [Actinomycetota bacterium]